MDYVANTDFALPGLGFSKGELIKAETLESADIAALIDNGFVEPITKKAKEKE
jgi:hypothetical protein